LRWWAFCQCNYKSTVFVAFCGFFVKWYKLCPNLVRVLINCNIKSGWESIVQHVFLHLNIVLPFGFHHTINDKFLERIVIVRFHLRQDWRRRLWHVRATNNNTIYRGAKVPVEIADSILAAIFVLLDDLHTGGK